MTLVSSIQPEAFLDTGFRDGTGENPIWDSNLQRWWWLDLAKGLIHRLDPATGRVETRVVGELLGSMALTAESIPVVSGESALYAVDFEAEPDADGRAVKTLLANHTHARPDMRFADGRCDRQGRFWFSSMVRDITLGLPEGRFWRYEPGQGIMQTPLDGFVIPNGSAFSPDGRTMYASDAHRDVRMVWAFDYDPDTGAASNRRVHIDMREMKGRPDGAAIDTDGCYWICCLDEGCIKRFTPDGRVDRQIDVPMKKPTMCAFGGDDMQTMFVTSLCRGEADLADDPHGGRVMIIRPGAQGIAEPRLNASIAL